MTISEEYQEIMTEYDAAVDNVQKNRKRFDGFFGLGHHPGNAPCHEIMDEKVKNLCARAAEEADPAEKAALTGAVLKTEKSWDGPEFARLMLCAIQRHTLELIPLLEDGVRRELAEWYGANYPRRERLPAQEKVYRALNK